MMTSFRFDCSNPRLRICEIHASTQENVTMEQMRLSFFWIMGGLNKEDLKVRCFVNEAEMSEIPLYNSEFVLADGGRWLRVEEMRKFSEYLPWWHPSYPAMGNS
ncbi:hypothetical protein A0H81_09192 [Grifola frondosa]|uniref:Uncharacterized protein n=1 Tax=Grifola frondosa TaxID=5627 RepID=A0A1C7M2Q1_GRIFR|nr:hypothetical protein A0H81_09192 [Grifola frondosa]